MTMPLHAMRLPVPGPACGPYPERAEREASAGGWRVLWRRLGAPGRTTSGAASRRRFVAEVRAAEARLPAHGSQAFQAQLRALQAQLGRQGFAAPLVREAFAIVARTSAAVLGQQPYDTQLIAARILLDNRLAEMATGEGKTLATMLAAATAALAGVPVHVVTANPYLVARDAERLAPVYAALGLRVAAIRPGDDAETRRAAYACHVVHATASDLIFDYLRDRCAEPGSTPLLRGLCMAIVDEADGVLIDEARTPFILAHERHDAAAERRHAGALALAGALRAGEHFRVDATLQRVVLEPLGREIAAGAAPGFGAADALWKNARFRDELIERALAALHVYRRDVHYLVRRAGRGSGLEIAIVDATTGRIAHGRRWSHGLHQMIELKERCPVTPLQSTQAQLSYQRFFPRYWRLAGLSGTLREARRELRSVYGLAVETVPLRTPSRRAHETPRLYADSGSRWNAVIEAVRRSQAAGRPVLVGTDSVADAQHLGERLQGVGLAHQYLDARQDADEAGRIARAGVAGCLTVATNLAGRGTDIVLGAGVAERGGLHVIACQQNASARIDRQLHGRAARAGDPGSVSTMLALDQGLLAQRVPRAGLVLLGRLAAGSRPLPGWLAGRVLAAVQGLEERNARKQRAGLLRGDRQMVERLGFGARNE
jgi:preprotein translocase subunit SecA